MKVNERIFQMKLRKVVKLDEMQMRFMPGKETIDAIFYCDRCLKNTKWHEKTCIWYILVYIERAFDHVPREVIWWAQRRKSVMARQFFAIMEMYKNIKTSVKLMVNNQKN